MQPPERLLLYGLVYARRPQRYLEIGSFTGGSARIACAALDAAGQDEARIFLIDPEPKIPSAVWTEIEHRTQIFRGYSPNLIPAAFNSAGGRFDFVMVDGDHGRDSLLRDLEGLVPFLSDGCYLLCHDAHYHQVEQAINLAVERFGYLDGGLMSVYATMTDDVEDGHRVTWGGFRFLCYRDSSSQRRVVSIPNRRTTGTRASGRIPPRYDLGGRLKTGLKAVPFLLPIVKRLIRSGVRAWKYIASSFRRRDSREQAPVIRGPSRSAEKHASGHSEVLSCTPGRPRPR
jgi:predicted O-methyltransferase YrrM